MATLPNYLLYDAQNNFICPIAEHETASVTWKRADSGTGTVVIPGDPPDDIFAAALGVHESTTLVQVQGVAGKVWTGRIHSGEFSDQGDKSAGLELTLVSDYIWLEAMLALVNPTGTITQQGTAESDTRTGPTETVVKAYVAAAALRLGVPVKVVPPPEVDSSPTIQLNARMTTLKELTKDVLEPIGAYFDVYMWRVGMPVPPTMTAEPAHGTILVDIRYSTYSAQLLWDQNQLGSYSILSTTPTAYRAVAGGKGDGVERVYTEYIDTTLRDKLGPWGLPEIFVDNDGTSGEEGAPVVPVPSPAVTEALAKVGGSLSVNFTVADGMPWHAGVDWWLDSFASARIKGQVFTAPISQVELTENAADGVTYAPTVGDPSPTRPEAVVEAINRLASDIRRRQAQR